MKKINSLDELKTYLGSEDLKKYFVEYMEELHNKIIKHTPEETSFIMNDDEMRRFIERIDCDDCYDDMISMSQLTIPVPSKKFMKAIRITLMALGYDKYWVDTTFRKALVERYKEKCQERFQPPKNDQITAAHKELERIREKKQEESLK